ncbi:MULTISPECIES: hypothetical protein [Bacillus]|uniref:hypothetical protein n=1 Tax=Bacillus TaxID=1386 RepID=UPI0007AA7CC5|nr:MULTISPECIES: hypothetical protein [Bacillus amyloliquefaciens group]KZE59962.1 permease [Bacillus amyloliquefaciens]MCQ9150030.1 ABC transporter permease [Bacillus amyloliquefaciens]WDN92663.1 ABC transporter permease [Bacillus velezensis]WOH99018.1 ABC transporter permease [Bacillus amyloliquefaciens]WOI51229.1 ABC transporter permease [Bacillus amyloliquefaciens]
MILKQLIIEVKENILKNKILSGLTIILSCLFFFLISVIFLQFVEIDTKKESFYAKFKNKNIYQLSDNLFDFKEEQFFSNPSELIKIKHFYMELNTTKDFLYLNTTLQPIGINKFKGNDTFLNGYEIGQVDKPYKINEKDENYSTVKSVQLNKNIFSVSALKLQEGSLFKSSDFIYEEFKEIPVLLGSDYSDVYKLGDIIEIDYVDKKLKGRVTGILDSNSVLPVRDQIEFNLDRYIILPELIIQQSPRNSSDLIFQQRHYLQLINGQLLSVKDTLEIRKNMKRISQKTGFEDYIVIGANGLGIDIVFSMLKQSQNLLILFALLLFILCILSISIAYNIKWDIVLRKYSIHLISGATINNIYVFMFSEVALIILSSLLIVFISIKSIGIMPWFYYLIMMVTGVFTVLLGILPVYIRLKKVNFSALLKGKE